MDAVMKEKVENDAVALAAVDDNRDAMLAGVVYPRRYWTKAVLLDDFEPFAGADFAFADLENLGRKLAVGAAEMQCIFDTA